MAIVQVLLALVFRSAGRLLNPEPGGATVMLFGLDDSESDEGTSGQRATGPVSGDTSADTHN